MGPVGKKVQKAVGAPLQWVTDGKTQIKTVIGTASPIMIINVALVARDTKTNTSLLLAGVSQKLGFRDAIGQLPPLLITLLVVAPEQTADGQLHGQHVLHVHNINLATIQNHLVEEQIAQAQHQHNHVALLIVYGIIGELGLMQHKVAEQELGQKQQLKLVEEHVQVQAPKH